MKIAFLCPGQGSQTPGMGRELYHAYPEAKEIFETGSRASGVDLAALCFDTPSDTLTRTENAQLAIFAVTLACAAALRSKGVRPSAAAGFSLGECSALCVAGALSPEDGFRLVAERGRLMQRAADSGAGAMCAVLGIDAEAVERLSDGTGAVPVNYNCPGQTVISGTPEGVEALAAKCREAGAKRTVMLALSGAFHTSAMTSAAEELKAVAAGFSLGAPQCTIYGNASAGPIGFPLDLPAHLARHMTRPVLWQRSVEAMIADGVDAFCEIGPGRTLSGFVGRIDKNAAVIPFETLMDRG